MSNVHNIFGNLTKIQATEDEGEIFDSLKNFIDEFVSVLEILIVEDERNKNNLRWYSSNNLIICGMTMLTIHEELIEQLIQEYKKKHGLTAVIRKTESIFRKIVLDQNNTMQSYAHLVDYKECTKRFLSLN